MDFVCYRLLMSAQQSFLFLLQCSITVHRSRHRGNSQSRTSGELSLSRLFACNSKHRPDLPSTSVLSVTINCIPYHTTWRISEPAFEMEVDSQNDHSPSTSNKNSQSDSGPPKQAACLNCRKAKTRCLRDVGDLRCKKCEQSGAICDGMCVEFSIVREW